MLVFFKARLVLLSVPKTATTAYESALRDRADMVVDNPPGLKHTPVYRYNRFFRPMFEKVCGVEMELMAVVREPVDWLGSWWRYRQRPQLEGRPKSTAGVSFDDFVEAYCAEQAPEWANVGSQARFLEPQANGVHAKYLFRYDDQDRIKEFLEDRLQHQFELPRLNISPSKSLEMSETNRNLLHNVSAKDFALYNSIL